MTELSKALGVFLKRGIDRREVAVFVHAFEDDARARDFALRSHAAAERLDAEKRLVVAHHVDAFEARKGAIDYTHVSEVVTSLDRMAQEGGWDGVRIFVDASRVYFESGRVKEWFAFETWLGPTLHASCGLICAYRKADLADPAMVQRVAATHAYRYGDET